MTISINQQVDYIWKKIGYGVAKTDTSNLKTALNESIPSPLVLPGDLIWVDSDQIPLVKPVSSTATVQVITVECIPDLTSTTNRTWLTNLIDWIPIQFGPTYLPKVYVDVIGSTTPEITGTQLYANGTDNDDEWFFDFQAGVLNFIGNNFPYGIDFTGKSVFVSGARYVGLKGVSSISSGQFGNIVINGYTITATDGNIAIVSPGGYTTFGNTVLGNVALPVLGNDVATKDYVDSQFASFSGNSIEQGDTGIYITDSGVGTISIITDGSQAAEFNETQLVINGEIFNSSNLVLSTNLSGLITLDTAGALVLASGDTSQRPVAPPEGSIRYNTDSTQIELFNGTEWISIQPNVQTQYIIGDDVTDTFQLDYETTSEGILVNINGVIQQPGVSYTVAGNEITFVEPPLSSERVEIRFIATLSTVDTETNYVNNSGLIVDDIPTIIDEFSKFSYRSAKYTISIVSDTGESQISEVILTHNGTSVSIMTIGTVSTAGTLMTFSQLFDDPNIQLIATGTAADNVVKIQKTYFSI